MSVAAGAAGLLLVSASSNAGGRPDDETRNWFPEFSGGWGFVQSDTDDVLEDDFMISGGALLWPSDWPVGIRFQAGYLNFDVSDEAIDAINSVVLQDPQNSGRIEDGELENWNATVNIVWGPGEGNNGLYLTGGLGVYALEGQLTNTGLTYYPPFCDPWFWWWCYPGGVGPGTIVQAEDSTTEVGWNIGLGYDMDVGRGRLFIEANYHEVDTDTQDFTYAPITIGYRW